MLLSLCQQQIPFEKLALNRTTKQDVLDHQITFTYRRKIIFTKHYAITSKISDGDTNVLYSLAIVTVQYLMLQICRHKCCFLLIFMKLCYLQICYILCYIHHNALFTSLRHTSSSKTGILHSPSSCLLL